MCIVMLFLLLDSDLSAQSTYKSNRNGNILSQSNWIVSQAEYDLFVKADQIFAKLNPQPAYKLDDGSANVADVDPKLLEELESVVEEFRHTTSI